MKLDVRMDHEFAIALLVPWPVSRVTELSNSDASERQIHKRLQEFLSVVTGNGTG